MFLDYFAGSGTTAHTVINLNREDGGNRKYLLIEMGEYFHTVLLPRIKKVVYSKDWRDGKPVSREGSSHCLKYYTLEQYEETLKNSLYEDGNQLELDSAKSPFEQYVFFGDEKLAHAVNLLKNRNLKIDLYNLYPDIDIAESLSNILGKPIRKRTADSVTFADGSTEKTNPETMTEEEKLHFVSLIKSYLWWGSKGEESMYAKRIQIKNYGPIEDVDITFPFDGENPKPVLLVGENGAGKSIFLSHIVSCLMSAQSAMYPENSEVEEGKVYKLFCSILHKIWNGILLV